MNNYEIFESSGNRITFQTEKTLTPEVIKQISQTISAGVRAMPNIPIIEWKKLNKSILSSFIYVNANSFQEAGKKLLEELSKKKKQKGFFISCFAEEIAFYEFDNLFKLLTKRAGVNEITWANAAPENGEQPFISLLLLE